MSAHRYNAPGIGGPPDRDESLDERVAELMAEDDDLTLYGATEIADREAREREESDLFDRGESLYEDRCDDDF